MQHTMSWIMLNTSFLRMISTNLQRKSQDRHNWINFSPNLCQRRMHHKRLHRTEYPLHQLLNHVLPLSPKLPLKMNHILEVRQLAVYFARRDGRAFADFEKNWLPIKKDWVSCFMGRCFNLGESMNNRLESFNGKIKSVCLRFASLYSFFQYNFLSMLRVRAAWREEDACQRHRPHQQTVCRSDDHQWGRWAL